MVSILQIGSILTCCRHTNPYTSIVNMISLDWCIYKSLILLSRCSISVVRRVHNVIKLVKNYFCMWKMEVTKQKPPCVAAVKLVCIYVLGVSRTRLILKRNCKSVMQCRSVSAVTNMVYLRYHSIFFIKAISLVYWLYNMAFYFLSGFRLTLVYLW